MQKYLSSALPIWEVAQDHIVNTSGDITAAFICRLPPALDPSEEHIRAIHQTWTKAIAILPPNTILHKQDWYWQSKWIPDMETHNDDDAFLARASDAHFLDRPFLEHISYIYIGRRPMHRPNTTSGVLLRRNLAPRDTLSPAAIADFQTAVHQWCYILRESGHFMIERLHDEDLAGTDAMPGLIEQYCQLIMPREPRVLQDIELRPDIRIGNKSCVFHSIADAENLPMQFGPCRDYGPWSTAELPFPIANASPLGLFLPFNHIYNQVITIEDPAVVRRQLERKGRRMESLMPNNRENALGREAIEAFLNEAVGQQKTIVRTHFNTMSWCEDRAQMATLSSMVIAAYARLGVNVHLETVGAAQIWAGCIPGNAGDIPAYEQMYMLGEHAACWLISDSQEYASQQQSPDTRSVSRVSDLSVTQKSASVRQSSITGAIVGAGELPNPQGPEVAGAHTAAMARGIRLGDRIFGRPVRVDLSDEPMRSAWIGNRNKAVFGPSGSGKSFFVNLLMSSNHHDGAHCLIVDIGNSYRGLCSLLEGKLFIHSEDQPLSFNPFRLPPGENPDIEKRESLKALLVALWKKEDETFLRSEYVALSLAIRLYYDKLRMRPALIPCMNSFYEFLRDEFREFVAADGVKEKDFDLANFLYVLRPFYCGGEFEYLLNARENLDLLNQRFIVFELDQLKDHPILFPVVTIVIMDVFIAKMRKLPGTRKVFLIEEAWKAIARQGMSEYLRYLFKTLRKFNGEAIVVSQEVDDILNSPIVRQAILNNADTKILLDQSKFSRRFEDLQQLLGLSERDKALVLSLNRSNEPGRKYKEVFIALGTQHSAVYRTEVSLEEYLVFTTEEREKLKVAEYAAAHGSVRNGVEALARDIRKGAVRLALIALMIGLSFSHVGASVPAVPIGDPIADIISMAIKRVIVATDLAIQRMQTAAIVEQQTQREAENEMQADELAGIADWVRKLQELYRDYYAGLWLARAALKDYQRVSLIVKDAAGLVSECRRSWSLLQKDPHFSAYEIAGMERVYGSMLDACARDVAMLWQVVTDGLTQMEDADRLSIIDGLAQRIGQYRRTLRQFTEQNIFLSLQRAKDLRDINLLKTFYGIQ